MEGVAVAERLEVMPALQEASLVSVVLCSPLCNLYAWLMWWAKLAPAQAVEILAWKHSMTDVLGR